MTAGNRNRKFRPPAQFRNLYTNISGTYEEANAKSGRMLGQAPTIIGEAKRRFGGVLITLWRLLIARFSPPVILRDNRRRTGGEPPVNFIFLRCVRLRSAASRVTLVRS
jgi:hypothetical protein